jgi:two-component system LytT family sensor kinase
MAFPMTHDERLPDRFAPMRRNKDVLFFAFNGLGWMAWGAAQSAGYTLFSRPEPGFLYVIAVAVISGIFLTNLLRYACRLLWRQQPLVLLLGGIATAYLVALPMRVSINLADQYFVEPDATFDHWYELFGGALWTMYLFSCWMGLYFGFRFYEANQREREKALRATALAQSAQLKMLRYQLNPHFLFNTLNAISTLVLDAKNDVANTVVTRLAEFLRYTLDQDPMKTVTLAQELTALSLYLEIEKMRFGSRLTVEVDVDVAAQSAAVPSLLLQPLIENAVKYAISPREQGGGLRIGGRLEGADLVLTVADDGPGLVDNARIDSGRGVGLRNTRERLYAMYGHRSKIELSNTRPGLSIALHFPAHI